MARHLKLVAAIVNGPLPSSRRRFVAQLGLGAGAVLVMPGEKATILMRFLDYPGTYLYHCHNLEHEDAGMMRNFSIDA